MKQQDYDKRQPPDGWTGCHAYMSKKHRYCRHPTLSDSSYCGNHQALCTSSSSNALPNGNSNKKKRKRIPCPLDNSHSIYEDTVDRHLKICPKAKQQKQQEDQPYYKKDINGGGYGDDKEKTIATIFAGTTDDEQHNITITSLEKAKNFALRVLFVHQRLFCSAAGRSEVALSSSNIKIRNLTLDDIESALPLEDLSSQELGNGLAEAVESYSIRSGGPKHLQQQASLLQHLRRRTTFASEEVDKNDATPTPIEHDQKQQQQQDPDGSNKKNGDEATTLLLELGAGRGMLGLVAASAFAAAASADPTTHRNVDLIMIERAGTRSKADTILRNHKSTLQDRCIKVEEVRDFQRIQCDLAHVDMPTVLSLHQQQGNDQAQMGDDEQMIDATDDINNASTRTENKKKPMILAIAKHLCGAGTDLALKALYPIRDQVQVCMMATCCHGVCTWEHYVGRNYLADALLTTKKEKEEIGDSSSISTTTTTTTTTSSRIPTLSEFGPAEFEMLRLWSAGTVSTKTNICNQKDDSQIQPQADDDDDEAHQNLELMMEQQSHHQQEEQVQTVSMVANALKLKCGVQGLGRACQRLLDYGRREYLAHVLFANNNKTGSGTGNSQDGVDSASLPQTDDNKDGTRVDLCYYVPSSVTPQNAVLIASRKERL